MSRLYFTANLLGVYAPDNMSSTPEVYGTQIDGFRSAEMKTFMRLWVTDKLNVTDDITMNI